MLDGLTDGLTGFTLNKNLTQYICILVSIISTIISSGALEIALVCRPWVDTILKYFYIIYDMSCQNSLHMIFEKNSTRRCSLFLHPSVRFMALDLQNDYNRKNSKLWTVTLIHSFRTTIYQVTWGGRIDFFLPLLFDLRRFPLCHIFDSVTYIQ